MPLTSGINSSSFSLGMEVLRAQVAATGRGEFTMGVDLPLYFQTPVIT